MLKVALAGVAAGLGPVIGGGSAAPAVAAPVDHVTFPAYRPPAGGITVDVTDFGAIGDGVTNDVQAFRDAMAALEAAGGGTLTIPPRTFVINSHVRLTSNVHIVSDGGVLTKTAPHYIWLTGQTGGQQGYGAGASNVWVEGVVFRGDFAFPIMGCAFSLHHSQDVIIDRCRFVQNQGYGHVMDLNGCRRITIRDCEFAGFKNLRGASVNRTECIQIDQSMPGSMSFRESEQAGYDALFTRDVQVLNCRFVPLEFEGVTYPCPNPIGAHAAREGHQYRNIIFRGNTVIDPTEDPSTPERDQANTLPQSGAIHFPGVNGMIIEDNEFILTRPRSIRAVAIVSVGQGALDTDPPLPVIEHGPYPPVISRDITIRNNRFVGFQPSAGTAVQEVIWLQGLPGGEIRDVTITGNTFEGGRASDGRGTFAVKATRCRGVVISDNVMSSSAGGVSVHDSTTFTISGNRVSAGAGETLETGIRITDGSSNGKVIGNRVVGFANGVDTTGAGAGVVVDGGQ